MGDRGRRKRLITGVYSDRFGVTVRVRTKEVRFPLGTPLEELKRARKDLQDELAGTPTRRGTLGSAFDAYLKTVPEGHRRRDEAALLLHWREAGFADLAPGGVKGLEIRQQLTAWKGRFSPATIKHLRRVLGAVYRAVNGKSGYNPVRDVPTVTLRYEEPRAIPYEIIELIFAQMPDLGRAEKNEHRSTVNKTKLRLKVMAYTGIPPAQLKRILPRDVDLRAKMVLARPRRKGAGADARQLPLTDQGVRAFESFIAGDCFGWFNTRSAAQVFRRAITKAQHAWEQEQAKQKKHIPWPLPDDTRAYDLRHSFGTQLLLATGDLKLVADMLLHANLSTTARYTLAAVDPRLKAGADALSKRMRGSDRGSARKSLQPQDN